jgi:hypothetical protein
MTKQQECDDAIAQLNLEKTRQTNAGHTLGAAQIDARIAAITVERNR